MSGENVDNGTYPHEFRDSLISSVTIQVSIMIDSVFSEKCSARTLADAFQGERRTDLINGLD